MKRRIERPVARLVQEFGRIDHFHAQLNTPLMSQGVDQLLVYGDEILQTGSLRAQNVKSIGILIAPGSLFDFVETLIEIRREYMLPQLIKFFDCVV
jgi:hypothetical protein